MEDMFTDELQMLIRMIVALKLECKMGTSKALKHQFTHNISQPYFGTIGQLDFLAAPDEESFTSFRVTLPLSLETGVRRSEPM